MLFRSRINSAMVKFTPSIKIAIEGEPCDDEKETITSLAAKFNVCLPSAILALFDGTLPPAQICEKTEIESVIKDWLK